MAIYSKTHKNKPKPRSSILILTASIAIIVLLYLLSSLIFTNGPSFSGSNNLENIVGKSKNHHGRERYLYWGNRIDCPGKHCGSCEGLGHQESSLRCALEEAMFLQRTFVLPSRMCINPIHNKKGILHQSNNASLEEMWSASSCPMDSLYDMDIISNSIPVILDNSKTWYQVLATSMKLGARGVAHLEGVSRIELKETSRYSNILLINRTASPLSWFMECKDRNNRSAIMLPYSFLPSMAAKKLRDTAEKIKSLLGDYDAMHVRRGDKLKTRKDRFGVDRVLHPHLDRDTRPEFIICRIATWVPHGRTLFIASNERTPGFFSPLSVSYAGCEELVSIGCGVSVISQTGKYKLAYASNFSTILDPLIENNYQLFMIERLIVMGARTVIRTFKEDDTDLSLTDDPKKNTKAWQIPVYTKDGPGC
ncbi:hypothetical protein RJ639_001968 [Escallonia herrerae]|uniref:O-fucosyltransferase family protein n=1 Tax=Escallonia herrerae TaxID=1293975 RepID=A0AA89BP22_9ASTE|nr:hypothetical protein RJ639_001968 [Escallonia herrerae]